MILFSLLCMHFSWIYVVTFSCLYCSFSFFSYYGLFWINMMDGVCIFLVSILYTFISLYCTAFNEPSKSILTYFVTQTLHTFTLTVIMIHSSIFWLEKCHCSMCKTFICKTSWLTWLTEFLYSICIVFLSFYLGAVSGMYVQYILLSLAQHRDYVPEKLLS